MNDHLESTTRRISSHTLSSGQKITLHGLGLQDYVAAREECLRQYRRSQISTWTSNVDLLGELSDQDRQALLRDAIERASAVTLEDLPKKIIDLPVMKNGQPVRDKTTGRITTQRREVEYTAWWMSETPEGRLFMTWLSMRRGDPELKLEDAEQLFNDAMNELETVADQVGEISTPQLGKSSAPAATGAQTETDPTEKRRARKRRRRQTGH